MYGPKSTGIAKWAGQVSFDPRGEIGDVSIEFGQRLDFAHVTPQAIELAKALYGKCCARCCCVHLEAIVTSSGNEFDKRFMKPRDCGVVNVTSSHNEHRSKSTDKTVDVN
jgi:hypothetical protein